MVPIAYIRHRPKSRRTTALDGKAGCNVCGGRGQREMTWTDAQSDRRYSQKRVLYVYGWQVLDRYALRRQVGRHSG